MDSCFIRSIRSYLNYLLLFIAVLIIPQQVVFSQVDYDIVYVRQPRFGDETNTKWPEVFHPASFDPGADLMLLHPDGTEELLVEGGDGSVTDPFISFDGLWCYYSYFPNLQQSALNYQRSDLPYEGSDIYRINLQTREIQRLTHQEFTPNTGTGNWDESNPVNPSSEYNRLGYGIMNLGPCPLPGGKIIFTSSRNGFQPPKGYTAPTLQLYVMDEDSSNVTPIAPMTISSALHPTILKDGRVMFSTHESQGLRDRRNWGMWTIYPDGRHWQPLISAFHGAQSFHFMTQQSNEDIVVVNYYNLNNNGFGMLQKLPASNLSLSPRFYPADLDANPSISYSIEQGLYSYRSPFTPIGFFTLSPFTTHNDNAAPLGPDGVTRVGKFTQPSSAPDNDLLVVWTPGPANDLNRPTTDPRYDAGLYVIPNGDIVNSPDELVLIKNDPNYNEAWPRAVVPYQDVYGVPEPAKLPWLPNDGTIHAELPEGTPYGLVGSSSFYKRESFPGWGSSDPSWNGLDVFNTSQNGGSSNWNTQGADAGLYENSDIWAVRLLAMEPGTHRSYGPNHGPSGGQLFRSFANERLRILGEIPLRKFDENGEPILDPEGNPDTSFLAKIPADTPFTFQTIDRKGLVLNMSQTWHQVRPGEARYDCGGCHAHSQEPLQFEFTEAAQPDYQIVDLSDSTPLVTLDEQGDNGVQEVSEKVVNYEFYRDIRPILQNKCTPCHTQNDPNPPAELVLDDYESYDGFPGDYARLANDTSANWGYKPVIPNGVWRQTNASRYVRKFQSRRSLLVWKLFGERLDGWTNDDHPTESVPGDATTLPDGASANSADLDFTGTMMPPPGSGVEPLTMEEKMTIARWIDLGAPINRSHGTEDEQYGWLLDDLRPVLTVSSPRPGLNENAVDKIQVGFADSYTGIDSNSFAATSNLTIAGRSPGEDLSDLFVETGKGIYELALPNAIDDVEDAVVQAEVADNQGNITRVNVKFSVGIQSEPTVTPTTPEPTATNTETPVPPTVTHTETPLPTATFTPVPPTATSTPTVTPTPTLTNTPSPTIPVENIVIGGYASDAVVGETVDIPIQVYNLPETGAVTFTISYNPGVLTWIGDIVITDTLIELWDMKNAVESEPGTITVAAAAFSADMISGDGTLITLPFQIAVDAPLGIGQIVFDSLYDGLAQASSLPIEINVVDLSTLGYTKGDVDNNEVLTAGDSQLAFTISLMQYEPTYIEQWAADFNSDQFVTSDDAQSIFDAIFLPPPAKRIIRDLEQPSIPTLTIENTTPRRDNTVVIPIHVDDAQFVKSWMMDVSYDPAKLEFDSLITENTLVDQFNLVGANPVGDGLLRVSAAALAGTPVHGDGVLVYIKFNVKNRRSPSSLIKIKTVYDQFRSAKTKDGIVQKYGKG